MLPDAMDLFSSFTARWFARVIGKPTAVQEAAWPVIAGGGHALVSAPTGTGKTLAAFLVFIDKLKTAAREGSLRPELHLIYISPLKSLAGDIRENLRRPMDGISQEEHDAGVRTGLMPAQLSVAVRTGDTPQGERRRMFKTPPHILITTPESLYLLLTGKEGQKMLKTARWVIIDELHALIDTKRGAHLMLSLARLDRLCPRPLQRIGLSATIRPLDLAAAYLSPEPAAIVAPPMGKAVELAITSPLAGDSPVSNIKGGGVWPSVAAAVYEHCSGTRTAIAFVEGRAYAEKLAYFVNQLGGEQFARTHHGSLARETRAEVEQALRSGALRLLCATSSMELGIDVGEIDRVFQIGCPRSISSTMQRLGRAGHNPGRVSVMHIFPRAPAEALYSGLTAEVVRQGGVEICRPPRLCLDVLAQHLVSMANGDGYSLDDAMCVLSRAYPFRDVTREDVQAVLRMLAGDFEHRRDIPVRPRILYDRIHEQIQGDPYSRMLAVSAGGTIPDRGLYTARTENGVKVGELDEEFVFEARVGDKFLLGSFAWKITHVDKDSVLVAPSSTGGAGPPFWHGEIRGRRLQTGLAFGELLRKLSEANETGRLENELSRLGLDDESTESVASFLKRQITATGILPDDRTILVEHFRDESGVNQIMVESVFGRPVNEPLAILAAETAKHLTGAYISQVSDDDGFLLYPYGDCELPESILQRLPADSAKSILSAALPVTPLFNMAFRYNAARALMMGVRHSGRTPLWVQRLRGAEMLDALLGQDDHPLIRETRRECLEDYWDLPGVERILNGIRSGTIQVRELFLDMPPPLSLPLRQQTEAAMMYDYAPQTPGMQFSSSQAMKTALTGGADGTGKSGGASQGSDEPLIEPSPEHLARVAERTHLPENEDQVHSLLMIEGDLQAGELDVPVHWLEKLARRDRVRYIEPGLWIAAEQADAYASALGGTDIQEKLHMVRRLLRYRGPHTAEQVGARYLWPEETALEVLLDLCQIGGAVESDGLFYHAELYDRARRETIKSRRQQIRTVPAERYAALLAGRLNITAPPEEKLAMALKQLSDLPFPAELWESMLLPARLNGYRPDLLDALLAQGKLFWRLDADANLRFHEGADIDWDADLSGVGASLAGLEKDLFEALLKRGASFLHRLSDLSGGESAYEPMQRLMVKGLVCADSFVPVRQWLQHEKLTELPVKQRARVRAAAQTSGRWEVARPIRERSPEQQLDRIFDHSIILCRETIQSFPGLPALTWDRALEILRVWEYTGRVRRGYFVEGLSGVQFVRDQDFAATLLELEQPRGEIVWLPAADPAQPWGKSLSHRPGRSFLNVPGTAVAFQQGAPAAVLERQGSILRVFDAAALPEALRVLAQNFAGRRIFPHLSRLVIRQYPPEAAEALTGAGFVREIMDYVLQREWRT